MLNCSLNFEIGDLDDGVGRVGHPEPKHRIDFYGHTVQGDGLLPFQIDSSGAHVQNHAALNQRNDPVQTWLPDIGEAAKPENNGALVFLRNTKTAQKQKAEDENRHNLEKSHENLMEQNCV